MRYVPGIARHFLYKSGLAFYVFYENHNGKYL